MAVCTSDQRLTCYDCNVFQRRYGVHTTAQQTAALWCGGNNGGGGSGGGGYSGGGGGGGAGGSQVGANMLVTGGVDGALCCWDLDGKTEFDPQSEPKHQGMVTKLLEVPMHK